MSNSVDKNYNIIDIVKDPQIYKNYDPRKRPWFIGAKKNKNYFVTDPYLFVSKQDVGITLSHTINKKNGELIGISGAEILLNDISLFLNSIKFSKNSEIIIIDDEKNEIIASTISNKENPLKHLENINNLQMPWITKAYNINKNEGNKIITNSHNKNEYITLFTKIPNKINKSWTIIISALKSDFTTDVKKTYNYILIISFIVLIISILLILNISSNISKPIIYLTNITNKIVNLNFNEKIELNSNIKEIENLKEAFSKLNYALFMFQKFIPSKLVKNLIFNNKEAKVEGENRILTVIFTDIKDFSNISINLSSAKKISLLSEYFDELSKIITSNNGTIDKYMDSSIMAFFGALSSFDTHPYDAVKASFLIVKASNNFNEKLKKEENIKFITKVGIHTGPTIVGNMGSTERLNYTVLGDSVNTSSRIKNLNSVYNANIIISDDTFSFVKDKIYSRKIDIIRVKGRSKPVTLYEVLELQENSINDKVLLSFIDNHEKAFNFYLKKDFENAIKLFKENLLKKSDRISEIILNRCENYIKNPPKDNEFYIRQGIRKDDII
jgi:adenylate cyclase